AAFVRGIIASHDPRRFVVSCYSDTRSPDDFTKRFLESTDRWHEIVGRSDEEVAALVRDNREDILVDLTGHIADNRMLLFARKPAPVQVTYIGYQNTSGLASMDYRITDSQADPVGSGQGLYT